MREMSSSSCLNQAVCSGRLHQIRLLLDIGVKSNIADDEGRTPLMIAACGPTDSLATRIARLLLCRGARVEAVDNRGRTALSYACQHGHCKLVKLLIDDDCDINLADKDGNTPLMYAAISGSVPTLREVLNVVLKYRLSVDLRNKKGFSAYLLAAKMANGECARILKIEANASVDARDTEFFLNGKEWAKKIRRNLEKETLEKSVQMITHRPRPRTSLELGRGNKIVITSCNSRTFSRLTTHSEPAVTRKIGQVDRWSVVHKDLECGNEGEITRIKSASATSNSSRQSTIPSVARTLSPDLHAIFSQYVLVDNKPAVTAADHRPPYGLSSRKMNELPGKLLMRESRNSRVGTMTRKKFSIAR